MSRVRPILRLEPFRPLARWIAVTVVLYLRESPHSVSPFLMVWRRGGLLLGFAVMATAGLLVGVAATAGLAGVGLGELAAGLVVGLGAATAATTAGLPAAVVGVTCSWTMLLRHQLPLLLSFAQRST